MSGHEYDESRGNSASDWATLDGGGLTQLIVSSLNPLVYYLFLNGQPVPQTAVKSLYMSVGLPENPNDPPMFIALLTRFVQNVSGERVTGDQALFPGTLDVVASKKRITVTSADPDDPLNVQVRLGLRSDGTGTLVEGGLKSIQVFLADDIFQVILNWEDGMNEDLISSTPSVRRPRGS